MINIVGRKIIMQKGDDESFNIILKDSKGNELPLSDTDTITLRMKYSMESNASLSKTTKIVKIDDKVYHIMSFKAADTINLPEGDYNYDVILESDNKRFTIVPKSIFTLDKSISLEDFDNNTDETEDVLIFDAEEIDYYSVIASTPLVGIFNMVNYNKKIGLIDDEIIEF